MRTLGCKVIETKVSQTNIQQTCEPRRPTLYSKQVGISGVSELQDTRFGRDPRANPVKINFPWSITALKHRIHANGKSFAKSIPAWKVKKSFKSWDLKSLFPPENVCLHLDVWKCQSGLQYCCSWCSGLLGSGDVGLGWCCGIKWQWSHYTHTPYYYTSSVAALIQTTIHCMIRNTFRKLTRPC